MLLATQRNSLYVWSKILRAVCVGCEMKASQEIAGALMSFYKKIKKYFLMTSVALEPLHVVFFLGLQSLQYTACAVYLMHEMQWYSSCL